MRAAIPGHSINKTVNTLVQQTIQPVTKVRLSNPNFITTHATVYKLILGGWSGGGNSDYCHDYLSRLYNVLGSSLHATWKKTNYSQMPKFEFLKILESCIKIDLKGW